MNSDSDSGIYVYQLTTEKKGVILGMVLVMQTSSMFLSVPGIKYKEHKSCWG
jgi:hypothetical protein